MARYERAWNVRGRRVSYKRKTPDEPMGRFGGGWQWEVGVQAGGSTVIVNLLTFYIRIERKRSMLVPQGLLGIQKVPA